MLTVGAEQRIIVMDARSWAVLFRTVAVVCGLMAAIATTGFFIADRSADRSAARGRRLSPEQLTALAGRLKGVVPKPEHPVTFGRAVGGGDLEELGQQLVSALGQAGFKVDSNVWPGSMIGSDPVGILVRQKPKHAPTGTQIVAALGSVGLAAHLAEYGEPGTLDIYIGRTPP